MAITISLFGQTYNTGNLSNTPQKFFGTTAPGSVTGNLPGDFFTDTTAHNSYVCNAPSGTATPACTAVAAAGWLLLNAGGAPSGAAGGALAGTYPNPTLAYIATNPQTGTTYAILTGDRDKLVTLTNGAAIAVSIAAAGSTGFPDGWETTVLNSGVGTATITPTTSTIEGAATLVLTTGQSARIASNGTNYRAVRSETIPIQANDASPLMSARTLRFENGTGTTWTLTDRGSGVAGLAPNIDTASLLTLTGVQTTTNKSFEDETTSIIDTAAPTKILQFEVGAITAGQTRILSVPDTDSWAITDKASRTANQFLTHVTSGTQTAAAIASADLPTANRTQITDCSFDGGGSIIATNAISYKRIPVAATIIGWAIEAVGTSPALTIDILKVASGAALPTASITAAAIPALTGTDNAAKSTTLTAWTTAMAANDIIGCKVTVPGAATWAHLTLYWTIN